MIECHSRIGSDGMAPLTEAAEEAASDCRQVSSAVTHVDAQPQHDDHAMALPAAACSLPDPAHLTDGFTTALMGVPVIVRMSTNSKHSLAGPGTDSALMTKPERKVRHHLCRQSQGLRKRLGRTHMGMLRRYEAALGSANYQLDITLGQLDVTTQAWQSAISKLMCSSGVVVVIGCSIECTYEGCMMIFPCIVPLGRLLRPKSMSLLSLMSLQAGYTHALRMICAVPHIVNSCC